MRRLAVDRGSAKAVLAEVEVADSASVLAHWIEDGDADHRAENGDERGLPQERDAVGGGVVFAVPRKYQHAMFDRLVPERAALRNQHSHQRSVGDEDEVNKGGGVEANIVGGSALAIDDSIDADEMIAEEFDEGSGPKEAIFREEGEDEEAVITTRQIIQALQQIPAPAWAEA